MAQLIHDPIKNAVLEKGLWVMAQLIHDPLKSAVLDKVFTNAYG